MQRTTYFAYNPARHTQAEAYEIARPLMYGDDSVVYVLASGVMGRHFDPLRGVECILPGFVLVQVSPDGTQLKI